MMNKRKTERDRGITWGVITSGTGTNLLTVSFSVSMTRKSTSSVSYRIQLRSDNNVIVTFDFLGHVNLWRAEGGSLKLHTLLTRRTLEALLDEAETKGYEVVSFQKTANRWEEVVAEEVV